MSTLLDNFYGHDYTRLPNLRFLCPNRYREALAKCYQPGDLLKLKQDFDNFRRPNPLAWTEPMAKGQVVMFVEDAVFYSHEHSLVGYSPYRTVSAFLYKDKFIFLLGSMKGRDGLCEIRTRHETILERVCNEQCF